MKTRTVALLVTLLLGLAACGGEGSPSTATGEGSPTPPPVVGSPSPAGTEEPPDGQASDQIFVRRPMAGDRVASPIRIAGDADVYEATVSLRLVTADGRILVEDFTTATCGSGCRGDYRTRLEFEVDEPTEATLEVFESSAEDGSPLHMVQISLTLLP